MLLFGFIQQDFLGTCLTDNNIECKLKIVQKHWFMTAEKCFNFTKLNIKLAYVFFQVGCGAIGCEMLKNYALLGTGTKGNGQVGKKIRYKYIIRLNSNSFRYHRLIT